MKREIKEYLTLSVQKCKYEYIQVHKHTQNKLLGRPKISNNCASKNVLVYFWFSQITPYWSINASNNDLIYNHTLYNTNKYK